MAKAPYTERLDELISQARHVGYLEAEANHAEHVAETRHDRRLRRKATEARKLATMRASQLDKMRERFLSSEPSEEVKAQGCVSAPDEG